MSRRPNEPDPGLSRRLAGVVLVATTAAALQWGLGPWLGLPATAVIWLVLCAALVTMGALLQKSRARAAAAEDRLMMAIEGTGIGVFDVDLVQRTFCASPALARLLGLPERDTLTPNWLDRLPVELVREHCRVLREQLERHAVSYEREITLNRPEGGRIDMLMRVRVVWRHGRPVRLRGAGIDITERRQVEAQLLAARTQLSQQVDDLHQLHELGTQLLTTATLADQLRMVLDVLAHFHGARRGVVSLLDRESGVLRLATSIGFDADALALAARLPGGVCLQTCREGARVVIADTASDARFANCQAFFEAQGIRAVHGTPLISASGEVLGALTVHLDEARTPTERECTLADICARKIAVFVEKALTSDELRLTRGRFETVLEASGAPFVILKPVRGTDDRIADFVWVYLNRAAAQTLGCAPERLLGQRLLDAQHARWADNATFEHCVRTVETARTVEFDAIDDTGANTRWFHCIASPMPDGVGVWFTDISGRKLDEQRLREGDRRKDEFLATLAHELRNPLAPIRQATLLAMSPRATEEQKRWSSEVIDRQVSHMALLLDDLLDVSRITRGALTLRKAPTDLSDVFVSAVETARPLIDAKGHRLHVSADDGPLMLDADPLRLAQVVANLLTNAAKYTDPGGSIRLLARRDGGEAVIEVHDNGIGIPADALVDVFRMFAQLRHAGERTRGGLGIGLALSKGLVELHGGSMSAHSEGPGRGSVFCVRLPAGPLSTASEAPMDDGPAPGARHRHVLIADDNRDASDTLAALLLADGHTVRLAYDGDEALALWHAHRPEICLLDIGMPGRSGHQVARAIRSVPGGERTLIVALTGWSQLHDRELALEAGFDLHLTKPVSPLQLARLMQTGARRHEEAGVQSG
jgi:PAS domain S-box-containing protein